MIGDFRLVRKLGEGGMGQVWEALQISLDRSVALKLMPSDRVLSETSLALFEREARAGGRLHHPCIVSVLAYGEEDGIPYIAQELVGDGFDAQLEFVLNPVTQTRGYQSAHACVRIAMHIEKFVLDGLG